MKYPIKYELSFAEAHILLEGLRQAAKNKRHCQPKWESYVARIGKLRAAINS